MKILVPDKEVKVDDLSDLFSTNDKSEIKISGQGNTKGNGKEKNLDPLTKEMIAIDSASAKASGLKQSEIADIYGVTQASVSHLGRGKLGTNDGSAVDENLKETTDRVRNNIENAAVSKLMSTLDLFDPSGLDSQMEVVTAAQKLAGVVEKIKGGNKDKGHANVSIVFYQPRMKQIKDYDVVDV